MIPWIGRNVSVSDGSDGNGGSDGNNGNDGNDGNDGRAGGDGSNFPIGNGTGITIGPFFDFLRMSTALAILAILSAVRNFNAANSIAIFFFLIRNGAVIALTAAIFAAFACKFVLFLGD